MYWNFFLNLLVSTLLQELLRPKQHYERPKPAGLDEFNFPTSSENRAIPYLAGTKKLTAPNCMWYGDLETKEVTRRVRTGIFSKEDLPMGYEYYLGMQLGLCVDGVDNVYEVHAGETKVWSGNVGGNSTIFVDGKWKEGDQDSGIRSYMDFQSGTTDPDHANGYLGAVLEHNPGYKHLTYCVFHGPFMNPGFGYVGISPHLRALAFVLRRLPKVKQYGISDADYEAYSAVGQYDANPAYVALELICNRRFGAGIPAQRVDIPAIVAAAARLKTEGNGLSLLWDSPRQVSDIVLEIAKQCNATLYTDLRTGLLKFDLLRSDDVSVFEFNDDNILRFDSLTHTTADEATNEIRIPFVDTAGGFKERAAVVRDIGGIEAAGRKIPATMQYPGVSNGPLALQLGTRDMRISGATLARCSLQAALPRGSYIHPGDLVKVSWSKESLVSVPMRVLRVQYSEGGTGEVNLDLLQDVFFPQATMFSASLPSMTVGGPGGVKPSKVNTLELIAAPYALSQDDADHALAYAFAPDENTIAYDLAWYNDDPNFLEYQQRRGIAFAAKGPLVTAVPQAPTVANVVLNLDKANAATLKRFGSRTVYFFIDTEMFQATSITLAANGTQAMLAGITRALWDTVPRAHTAGSRVVVLCDYAIDPARLKTVVYHQPGGVYKAFDGQQVLNAKAVGRNDTGSAALGDSVAYYRGNAWGTNEIPPGEGVRALLPYSPGNVKLAGQLGGGTKETGTAVSTAGSQMVLSWTPRARTAGGLSSWAAGDMRADPATGTSVVVESFNGSAWVVVLNTVYYENINQATLNVASLPKGPLRATVGAFTIVPSGGSQAASLFSSTWYWFFA